MLSPKKYKHRKVHKGRLKGTASRGCNLVYGTFGLKAIESGWITSAQIEAGRRVLTKQVKKHGKLWIRIFPDKPVTSKPIGTRMGSGSGSLDYWVAVVRKNTILFEIKGLNTSISKNLLRIVGHKMPVKTKIVFVKL